MLHPYATTAKFDTDSFKIGVDTLCSITMSANKSCFKNLKPITGSMVRGIASGLPVGGDLEYADELTLGRALEGRRDLTA